MPTEKIYRQAKTQYRTYTPIPENEGYTVIGAGSCYNMRGYQITVPEGVEIIEPYAFAGCEEFCRLELPSTLKEIGEGAFLDCTHLREITVPPSVERIGDLAFHNCGRWVRGNAFVLTVPDSVKTVGRNVYRDLPERGEPIPRPTFTGVIRFCRNDIDETFTLTGIDPYTAGQALTRVGNRPFVLLAVTHNTAVIYSYDDEKTLVLPLGKTIHTETTHTVGAAYEYTDMTTTFLYLTNYTLTELSFG